MIVPVNVPVVTSDGNPATTDANGTFNSVNQIHPANWSVVRLVGQVAGSGGLWTLLTDNGLPLDFAPGALASMGLVLVAPGQRLTLQIKNATGSAAVNAQFVGIMAARLEEVLPFYSPSPNPLSVDTAATPLFQGPLQGSPGGTNLTLSLPGTCYAILVIATAVDANSHVKVAGLQSGKTYLDANMTAVGQQLFAPTAGAFDPRDFAADAIVVTVTNATSTNTAVYFLCKGAVIPANTKSFPLHVLIDGQPVTVQGGGFGGVLTVQPAAGFASQAGEVGTAYASQELITVTSVEMVTGLLGKSVRVFGWNIEIDQATGTTIGWLEDENFAVGAVAGRIAAAAVATGSGGQSGNHSGTPITSGKGLRLNVPAVSAGVVRAQISFRQD